jgi:hypothetical protein
MLTRNSQEIKDAFALILAKSYKLSLRNLQFALERCAAQSLSLDLVLLDMKLMTKEKLAEAAEAVDYVLTAEQEAKPPDSSNGHRVFARQDSRLKVEFEDWDNLKVAYTNNISRGGLGVTLPISADEPAIDSVVSLSLSLPDGNTLQLTGRVCYCRDGEENRHVGIQLHHQHAEELLEIDELLRSNET